MVCRASRQPTPPCPAASLACSPRAARARSFATMRPSALLVWAVLLAVSLSSSSVTVQAASRASRLREKLKQQNKDAAAAAAAATWSGSGQLQPGAKAEVASSIAATKSQEASAAAASQGIAGTMSKKQSGLSSPAPRVAICFFGQVKNFNTVEASVRQHIFGPLEAAGYTYDVFAATYNLSSTSNVRNGEFNVAISPRSLEERLPGSRVRYLQVDDGDGLYDLKEMLRYGDPWLNGGVSVRAYMLQQLSLRAVTALWRPHALRYKYVLYLRPDVTFLTPLDLPMLAPQLNDATIAIPAFHEFKGLNDRLAFGTPAVMAVYGTRMARLWRYVFELRKPPHAESFVLHVVQTSRWKVLPSRTCFERQRANGKVALNDLNLCKGLLEQWRREDEKAERKRGAAAKGVKGATKAAKPKGGKMV